MAEKNDSQEKLASLLKIGVSTVNMKLQGQREFKLSEIKKLCRRYDRTFEELFY